MVSVHHVGAHAGEHWHGVSIYKSLYIWVKHFFGYLVYETFLWPESWRGSLYIISFHLPGSGLYLLKDFDFDFDLFRMAWHWKPAITEQYSSRKIALKTARDGEKNMSHDLVNIFFKLLLKICFKFCILEQIITTVLFICISSINNQRSLLKFQSTTAPTNRGCCACD